jgi:hypothetical protein
VVLLEDVAQNRIRLVARNVDFELLVLVHFGIGSHGSAP